MARVKHADALQYICKHIRTQLTALADPRYAGIFVGNREPPAGAGTWKKSVIVRVDGNTRTSLITRELSLGIRVRAGQDHTDESPATDLALEVLSILEDCPGIQLGNPVAAVTGSNGPYSVTEEGEQPAQYFTITLDVVGEAA